MVIKKFFIVVILALYATATVRSSVSDFDKVCGYFENLRIETTSKKLSKTDKLDFINNLVKKELKPDSYARLAWEVVVFAAPEVRYELYKTSAQETTKNTWQCNAMEKLILITGE